MSQHDVLKVHGADFRPVFEITRGRQLGSST